MDLCRSEFFTKDESIELLNVLGYSPFWDGNFWGRSYYLGAVTTNTKKATKFGLPVITGT